MFKENPNACFIRKIILQHVDFAHYDYVPACKRIGRPYSGLNEESRQFLAITKNLSKSS